MSFTQTMRISKSYIENAEIMLRDAMDAENSDPDYSLSLAVQQCESAIENIELARQLRKALSAAPGKNSDSDSD